MDGIQQRSEAAGLQEGQFEIQFFGAGSESLGHFRAIGEIHQEGFIGRVHGLEKLLYGLTSGLLLVAHAAAAVVKQARRKGAYLRRKG